MKPSRWTVYGTRGALLLDARAFDEEEDWDEDEAFDDDLEEEEWDEWGDGDGSLSGWPAPRPAWD